VRAAANDEALDLIAGAGVGDVNTANLVERLQATMADDVGPLRTQAGLMRALARIDEIAAQAGDRPPGDAGVFDMRRLDWFDLRNMLLVARTVTQAALRRTESRGAHQREDFPGMLPEWRLNQVADLQDGRVVLSERQIAAYEVAAQ
jgi:succinate dehydrogenase/fumarate reductase flavoprotein subunit